MKNRVDSFQNVDLILTSHHVRLCLIRVEHITSLQKISIMRKCGYHNQVQDLIRGSVLYKFVSVLKKNNPHLGLCFVELENAYQKMIVLPGTKMFMLFFPGKCVGEHSGCSRLGKENIKTSYRTSKKICFTSRQSN